MASGEKQVQLEKATINTDRYFILTDKGHDTSRRHNALPYMHPPGEHPNT